MRIDNRPQPATGTFRATEPMQEGLKEMSGARARQHTSRIPDEQTGDVDPLQGNSKAIQSGTALKALEGGRDLETET